MPGSTKRWGLPRRSASKLSPERSFRLRQIRPASLFGKGQVEEIAELAEEHEATLLVVDAALTPGPAKDAGG